MEQSRTIYGIYENVEDFRLNNYKMTVENIKSRHNARNLVTILGSGITSYLVEIYDLDNREQLQSIAHLQNVQFLQEIIGSFNFYNVNYLDYLFKLHPHLSVFNKEEIYSEEKTSFYNTILKKLDKENISYDESLLKNYILYENF